MMKNKRQDSPQESSVVEMAKGRSNPPIGLPLLRKHHPTFTGLIAISTSHDRPRATLDSHEGRISDCVFPGLSYNESLT